MALHSALHLGATEAGGVVLPVRTKSDIAEPAGTDPDGTVRVSALQGAGLDVLLREISAAIAGMADLPDPDSPIVAHARYRSILMRARDEVLEFRTHWQAEQMPVTVAAVHLREALRVLEEMIGAVGIDDVLDRVFSTFCVGK
jgi:tRNA modification GTPase